MDSDHAKIFVGGISWETSEEKLRDYFSSFGSVVEAVIVKDRATGRARGFGFVAFSDPGVVDRVVLEKHNIDGRMVEVKKAVPREEQQNMSRSSNAISVSGSSARTSKIFVGGLASTVTEEDFKKYFSQFGEITDVVVMYDPNTQRPRGFGFITFDSEDAVERVLQQNTFHEIHDKLVEVKKAVPRELSGGRASGAGGGFGGGGRGSSHHSAYAQGGNSGLGSTYNATRYAPPPTGRGGFQSYGPGPYGSPGFPGPGYSVPMNGAYGTAAYGGGVGYPPAGAYGGGYGNPPPSAPYGGAGGYGGPPVAPMGAYVGGPVGPRSPWGTSAAPYGGGGSPAAYGSGPGMSGYPNSGWSAGAAPQSNGSGTPYGSNGYGYGTNDSPGAGGYPPRGMAAGPVGGYADPYSTGWKSGDTHNSPVPVSGAGVGSGYGSGMGAGSDGAGYGVAGRQTQRGPDARFRPYPAASERAS
ncbi:hypothetical protein KP509_04G042300 [Ceratopteris richardii]|uniref:RRM domain-containing protein n=3 Tax=Ceratopteris richardii TaxID=49495 RepID=A0A8T2US55_CERRI|nr:hypothetical protein KP509_04G042300 [Ceratopteris richardii]KAH7439041.1 hypothetical protein KP509_04G042300 [Ceratopteris richardii]KAH7439042.1 hypothetical protein KP509_04G042300 [Ceratopteris richardii]KAH7439043.1 hypothetical protein KP509_04G042300 [Ceratopteris richardii]